MKGFSSPRPFLLPPAWAVKLESLIFRDVSGCRRPEAGSILAKVRPRLGGISQKGCDAAGRKRIWVAFERRLERALVPAFVLLRPGKPAPQRSDYPKWPRCHLDFCHKH